jgi:hypothetical protein
LGYRDNGERILVQAQQPGYYSTGNLIACRRWWKPIRRQSLYKRLLSLRQSKPPRGPTVDTGSPR